MIKIIRRNTGTLSPETALETRRPLEVRQREQQEFITREVELLRRRLPAIRLSFTYQLEDLTEFVRGSLAAWKREKLALSSLLTGIPLSLAECLLDPNLESGDFGPRNCPSDRMTSLCSRAHRGSTSASAG